jgi:hypothetical protein
MNTAIAQKLNVLESAIVRVEEWANVLFVVVKGLGARFVSKKVIKVENLKTVKKTSASALIEWRVGRKFEEKGAVWETISAKNTDIYWDEDQDDEIAVWAVEAVFVRNIP